MDIITQTIAVKKMKRIIQADQDDVDVKKYTGSLVNGAWDSKGTIISVSAWVRSTEDHFKRGMGKRINMNTGYRVMLIEFDYAGKLVTRTTINETFDHVKTYAKMYLCIGRQDNTAITVEEAEENVWITDIPNNCSRLKGKTWVIKGDSLTDIQHLTGIKKYHQYVSEKTGIIVDAWGDGGSGYARPGTNTDNTKVTSNGIFHEGIAELPAKADYFTLFGGTNDWKIMSNPLGEISDTSLTSINGLIRQAFEKSQEKYAATDTKISVFTPLPRVECYPNNEHNGDKANYTLSQLSDRLMELAEIYGFRSLDLYRLCSCYVYNEQFRSRYMYDSVHYNSRGNERISNTIIDFLESN